MDSTQGCSQELQESLVAYAYDECDEAERERVSSHIAACAACASELEALREVRGALQQWEVPESALGFRLVADSERLAPWWRRVLEPSWGLAAAAGLVLVVAAAVASVEVRYDANGFVLQMGWVDRTETGSPMEVVPVTGTRAVDAAPWQADFVRLEGRLRQALSTEAVTASATSTDVDHSMLLGEIEQLIAQSERRQKQEVAVWFTQFAQEFDMQRRADQQRFVQDLGALEGVTDYLVRVSQR